MSKSHAKCDDCYKTHLPESHAFIDEAGFVNPDDLPELPDQIPGKLEFQRTPSPTPQDDELERGVDIGILLRTKIRNTLYNNEIGFSMKNAGSRNAVQMVDDLVEQLAAHAEHLIQKSREDGYREALDKINRAMAGFMSISDPELNAKREKDNG